MYSVCPMKHLLERGVIVLDVLEEALLGELWLGLGLCEGLDIVNGVHLLSGEVCSVTTALKVVEEVQEGLQEIERE